MHLDHVELRRVTLPLVTPFRTAHGTSDVRDALLVRVVTVDGIEGWGECVAMAEPTYTAEWVDGAHEVTRRFLLPLLHHHDLGAADVAPLLHAVKGHPMAKAGIEAAVLDAELRAAGVSLATHLGAVRDRVPSGVAVGIAADVDALLATVDALVAQGYLRVKLKIGPGWDVEPVRAVRSTWPELRLQVDANSAYTPADTDHLRALDAFGLLLIEQPFAEDDLDGHAGLAAAIETPVCLDESITSARTAREAIERGACEVVNLKPGRVGGILESLRIHELCLDFGVPIWIGGMLETGVGRAVNTVLAALPGCTLPGDLSASSRWFHRDVTEPFVLDGGHLRVPRGPGIGVVPRPDALDALTTRREIVELRSGPRP